MKISAFKKLKEKVSNKVEIDEIKKQVLVFIISFFCGRAIVFNNINPFALPVLASLLPYTGLYYSSMLAIMLSVFIENKAVYAISTLLSISILTALRKYLNKENSPALRRSILLALSIFLASLINVFLASFSILSILTMIFQVFISAAFTYLLSISVDAIFKNDRNVLSQEEYLSILLLMAGVIVGSANLYISYFYIGFIIACLVSIIASYQGGSIYGAAAGLVAGFSLMLSSYYTVNFIVILSVSSLIAGALTYYTKFAVAFGFLISTILLSFYLDSELLNYNLLISIMMATAIFLLIPKKYFKDYSIVKDNIMKDTGEEYLTRLRNVTDLSLSNFSDSFKLLSKKLKNFDDREERYSKDDATRMIDHLAAEVCDNCSKKEFCWQSNFYNTYQNIFSVLSILEEKGHISQDDINNDLKSVCIHLDSFIVSLNRMFELTRQRLLMQKRIEENRELISEQMGAVSEIIDKLADDIDLNLVFHKDLEAEIKVELDKKGIEVSDVIVMQNKSQKYEVNLNTKTCFGRKKCVNDIVPVLSKVLNRKMEKDGYACSTKGGSCVIKINEAAKYRVFSGVSRAVQTNSKVSGDNYTSLELSNGKYLFALSDGMGSGLKANKESEDTIELLEQFVEAGFNEELAVKLINSALVLKSDEDIFSTLDILSIDLYTGIGEFIKVGAAETYIIRDNEVKTVHSNSLPVGIIKDIELDRQKIKLRDNDMILLLTDGVKDSSKKQFIEEVLKDFKGKTAKDLSDYIINLAKNNNKDYIFDDMTALAVKLSER